ncbi:hypothetical protein JCM8547_008859 [Rhodosporidiobolus lusitaniae]
MTLLTPPRSSPEYSVSPTSSTFSSASDEAAFVVASSSHTSRRRPSFSTSQCQPDAKRPRSSLSHRRPSLSHSSHHAQHASSPERLACPSLGSFAAPSVDWVAASLAAAKANAEQQEVPGAPKPEEGYCETPALTPEEGEEGEGEVAGVIEERQQGAGKTGGFVRRDDLTARAVAKAQAMQAQQVQHIQQKEQEKVQQQQQQQQEQVSEKDRFVNGLVDASVLAIDSIWGSAPCSSPLTSSSSGVLPLHWFVKEVLRRSRTSCSTLQLALYYLHKSRREIREAVKEAERSKGEMVRLEAELKAVKAASLSPPATSGVSAAREYPSPPHSPSSPSSLPTSSSPDALLSTLTSLGSRFSLLVEAQNSPILCGRRMFLAALISASKYLQDRNYSNRAWAKISGLEVREVNRNERAFLRLVGWELGLRAEEFQRWTERLSSLASPSSSISPSTSPSPSSSTLLSSLPPSAHHLSRHGLARSSSEYVAAPASLPPASSGTVNGVVGQRGMLARGASVPTLAMAGGVGMGGGKRERAAFPIAVAQARPSVPASTASLSSSSAEPRKLRALPSRRLSATAAVMDVDGGRFVPASWSAGGFAGAGVGVGAEEGNMRRRMGAEGVRAH